MLKGIIDILINDSDIISLVGMNKAGDKVKVYPGICPEPEQWPFIVLLITSAPDYAPSKGHVVNAKEYTFNAMVYHKNYEDVETLTDAVIGALDQTSGTFNTVDFSEIRYQTFSDGYVDDYQLHVRTVTFSAITNED